MSTASRTSVLRVFRAMLREAKQIQRKGIILEPRLPLDGHAWGSHGWSRAGPEYTYQVLEKLFPFLSCWPSVEHLDGEAIRKTIRDNFKAHKQVPTEQSAKRVDEAFTSLRLLLEQQYLQQCSSSATTDGVKCEATSMYNQYDRGPSGQPRHIFSYRVRVTNQREERIRVMGREWVIKDGAGNLKVHIPLGPNAVVGQQPVIPPGQCFEYISGTDLPTPTGLQRGSLLVEVLGPGKERAPVSTIQAAIGPFPLLKPGSL